MKKSLLALSILGAFAGVAQAQTNVTMYGVVDVGLVRDDNGQAKVTKLDSSVYSGSRLGFKGTEDLGGGLQALFVLETGLNVDTGGFPGLAFARQSYVGLGGNFGSVKLGRQQNFFYYATAAVDPFGIGLAGNSLRMFTTPVRNDNVIKYESPTVGGFSGGFAHSFGEVVGQASAGASNSVAGQYSNGPIFVDAVYDQTNNKPAAGAPINQTKTINLGGTYDFGVVKAHAMFDRVRDDSGVNYRDYLAGVSVPFGASTFLADYIKRKDKSGVAGLDAKQVAVGYTYNLSKRTTLYTSYARTSNDFNQQLGGAAAKGLTDKNFDVGVRHTF